MLKAQTILSDLSHLFFPKICAGCATDIVSSNHLLCLHCLSHLNQTQFAFLENNPVEKTWWGRMSVVAAMSQFYFTKNSLLQALIHQLKYKGNREIGLYFGKMIGYDLQASERFQSLEVLIPLPLFPDKEKKRGYNQATLLCEGIAGILNLPVATDEVQRVRATDTQTHKKRMERWENVETVFATRHSKSLENKNILLVDDVITTGATLEACGKAILEEIPGVQLSIATLAYADN